MVTTIRKRIHTYRQPESASAGYAVPNGQRVIERKQLRDKRRVLLEGLKEEEEDKRSLAASEEENQRVREERVADAHDRRWERGPEWKEEKEQRIAGILKAAREKAESEIEAPS